MEDTRDLANMGLENLAKTAETETTRLTENRPPEAGLR